MKKGDWAAQPWLDLQDAVKRGLFPGSLIGSNIPADKLAAQHSVFAACSPRGLIWTGK